jgi:hypothetical protein
MYLNGETASAPLGDRLRDAYGVTAEFMTEIISETGRLSTWPGRIGRLEQIDKLVQASAWTDAALALIDLELPQWQLRRLIYDGGEWHCALSRQRELPDWLDGSIESKHMDLALAILSALVEVRRAHPMKAPIDTPSSRLKTALLSEPLLIDNFG